MKDWTEEDFRNALAEIERRRPGLILTALRELKAAVPVEEDE